MDKSGKSREQKILIGLRGNHKILEAVNKLAKKENRSRTAIIRQALRWYLSKRGGFLGDRKGL